MEDNQLTFIYVIYLFYFILFTHIFFFKFFYINFLYAHDVFNSHFIIVSFNFLIEKNKN